MQRFLILCLATVLSVSALAVDARAHWDEGDDHKMHWAQLPDPNGWDITVAIDDFRCTASGPITDIHFWVSWKDDQVNWSAINNIELYLTTDVPAVQGPYAYSTPGDSLWNYNTFTNGYTYRLAGEGDQGWYQPQQPRQVITSDHEKYYQVNVSIPEDDRYNQTAGTIYWLGVAFYMETGSEGLVGWKTTTDDLHWMDYAVYPHSFGGGQFEYRLLEPETDQFVDMAFVIVPEPTSLALLALGGLVLVRRRSAAKPCREHALMLHSAGAG